MYLSCERVASSGAVKTQTALTIPAKATQAEIQADSQNVRYTMDATTDPTSTLGMLFLTTDLPKTFLIDDVRRIRFTQGAGGAGAINIHYFAGRDV